MPSRRSILEDAIVIALSDRLERAGDLISRSDATDHLDAVAKLCDEARTLALAGRVLLRPSA
jgi:hypothetical protein